MLYTLWIKKCARSCPSSWRHLAYCIHPVLQIYDWQPTSAVGQMKGDGESAEMKQEHEVRRWREDSHRPPNRSCPNIGTFPNLLYSDRYTHCSTAWPAPVLSFTVLQTRLQKPALTDWCNCYSPATASVLWGRGETFTRQHQHCCRKSMMPQQLLVVLAASAACNS